MQLAICVLTLLCQTAPGSDWTPPAKPDPHKILREARADREDGRYSDALAKHLWFYHNALKYQPSLSAVRLSFGVMDWAELGKVYPLALVALKSIRDETAQQIRAQKENERIFKSFQEYAAINGALGEQSQTTDLFVWLDANRPKQAEEAFGVAEAALIKSKKYRLCGKYLHPDESLDRAVEVYHVNKRMSAARPMMKDFSEKFFTNHMTTLVALLVQNDRQADATRIAAAALKELDTPEFRAQLEKAKKGELPPAWP